MSWPCLNDLPEPYFTKSLAHLNAIQNAPSRHALFEALDIGLNYLRELSARHVLTLEETVELGRLWGDAADKRLRALPEQGAPASIHFFTKNPPLETTLDPVTQNALLHLLSLAERDTGQSRKAANFLLAWWNAVENGGFDLTDLYGLNQESASACAVLFGWVAKHDDPPKKLGYGTRFEALALKWRSRE